MAVSGKDDDLAYVTEAGMGADLDAMLVFNLLRTYTYLAPFVDAELRRHFLTSAQFNALLVLRTAGADGLLMSEIGQRLVVTRANVTGLVDRLERQGLVARADRLDRRATAVCLTDAGVEVLARTVPGHGESLSTLTAGLTGDEKRTLIRILTRLRADLRNRRKEEA